MNNHSATATIIAIIHRQATAYAAYQEILPCLLEGDRFTLQHADLFLRKYDPTINYNHPVWRMPNLGDPLASRERLGPHGAHIAREEAYLFVTGLIAQSHSTLQPSLLNRFLHFMRREGLGAPDEEATDEEPPG